MSKPNKNEDKAETITLKFLTSVDLIPMGKITFNLLPLEERSQLTRENRHPKIVAESVRQMKSVGGVIGIYNEYPMYYMIEYEGEEYLMKNLAHGQVVIGIRKVE